MGENYTRTALSEKEYAMANNVVANLGSFKYPIAFVGNVGSKIRISPREKGRIKVSDDVDIVTFSDDGQIIDFAKSKGWDVHLFHPIRRSMVKYGSSKVKEKFESDPFDIYEIMVADGNRKTKTDVFTLQTGVTFIPVNESDSSYIENIDGIPVVDLGFLLATHLNPYAMTDQRLLKSELILKNLQERGGEDADAARKRFRVKMLDGFNAIRMNGTPEEQSYLSMISGKVLNTLLKTAPAHRKANLKKYGIIDIFTDVFKEVGVAPTS